MSMVRTKGLGIKQVKRELIDCSHGDKYFQIKPILTTDERLDVVSRILNTVSSYNSSISFLNIIQLRVFTWLHLIEAYTNIRFNDKQWEEPTKTYDMMMANGFKNTLMTTCEDIREVIQDINDAAEELYRYKNSALGVLEAVQSQYDAESLNMEKLNESIANPESLSFLKEVMEKMG